MTERTDVLPYGLIGFLFSQILLFSLAQLVQNGSVISPVAEAKNIGPTVVLTPTPTIKNSRLPLLVEKEMSEITGTYAAVIKNLKTKETYQIHEHELYETASLYKLWVMATVMEQLNTEILTEDKIISDSVQGLNASFRIDPELAERTEGTVQYTVDEALEQMITISHNYAALLLGKTVRLKNVQAFLTENGFVESNVGEPPQTTAADIALFLEKLYKKKLVSTDYSDKMLSLLKNQKLKNKLPKYLPEDTMIAHKTGELGTYSHDAGIIFHPKGDYIIVVLTDSPIPSKSEEIIAKFSKAVYDYFLRNE